MKNPEDYDINDVERRKNQIRAAIDALRVLEELNDASRGILAVKNARIEYSNPNPV